VSEQLQTTNQMLPRWHLWGIATWSSPDAAPGRFTL